MIDAQLTGLRLLEIDSRKAVIEGSVAGKLGRYLFFYAKLSC